MGILALPGTEGISFDPRSVWGNMGYAAKFVVLVLVHHVRMVDRRHDRSAHRLQRRAQAVAAFAPAVAGALREGKLDEAIKIADRYNKSHLAKVVVAGLQEFKAHQMSAEIPGEEIEASAPRSRTCRSDRPCRIEARRQSAWRQSAPPAPFVGLFGTVVGIMNAFKSISTSKSTGLGAVAGGISEALITTAVGLFVAIPAVWMFNYFTNRIEAFDVEMDNSSSELIDYFLKRSAQRIAK